LVLICILKTHIKGNKIIVANNDLIKIISIKLRLEEANLTNADIKEKNNEAKEM
tara:strand:+ start:107 stop:268 length:162 start_codon:yes stop_codon:yes gene_type:complete